jgi:hypothetical protein
MDFGHRTGSFRLLIRDRDARFIGVVNAIFAGEGVKTARIRRGPRGRTAMPR